MIERERAAALVKIHKDWLLHDAAYYEWRGARGVPGKMTDEERQEALGRIAALMEEKARRWERLGRRS